MIKLFYIGIFIAILLNFLVIIQSFVDYNELIIPTFILGIIICFACIFFGMDELEEKHEKRI